MWAQERHRRIQGLISSLKQISTDSLSRELGVSRETIRRDLLELEAAGLLRRVHGGAVVPEPKAEEPFANRLGVRRREKQAIARAALDLIQPGQSCFIDAGTTTALLAGEIATIPNVTVFTNSIDVATTMRTLAPGNETILLGGRLSSDVPGTYGELTLSEISRLRADIALLSPVGVHPEHGITDFVFCEAEVARAMAENSQKVVLLADSSKLGVTSRVQFAGCRQISALVTDDGAESSLLASLEGAGVGQILLASG